MVFPVVMYGCESWTIKKTECKELMLLNCGVREDSESPLDCKEIQSVNPKECSNYHTVALILHASKVTLKILLGLQGLLLKLKLQYFGHLMRRTDSLEETLMLGGTRGRRRMG